MKTINVTIKEVGGRETPADLPDDQPVSQIIQILITKMGLPSHQHGDPLHYILDHVSSSRRLQGTDTLAAANVQEGDILLLLSEPRAGE